MRALLVAFLFLVLVAPAQALVVTGDDVGRYQVWANQSRMPLPDVAVVAREASCPNGRAGCTTYEPPTIWMSPMDETRGVFLHEVGHLFDRFVLTDLERGRFLGLTDDIRQWRSPPNSPHERFAVAYSLCARGKPISGRHELGYGLRLTVKQYRAVCRMIANAGT